MSDADLVRALLVEGAIGGALVSLIAFLLSRFLRDSLGRGLLAILLITAAGAYFGFAVAAGPGSRWIPIELAHVVAFGALALMGLRGSAGWLALGWALHPLWDAGLHAYGPGRAVAPLPYAIACISFDLVVAAYIALAYGAIGARRLGFR